MWGFSVFFCEVLDHLFSHCRQYWAEIEVVATVRTPFHFEVRIRTERRGSACAAGDGFIFECV